MRWTCSLCFLLLALPAAASAQDDGAEGAAAPPADEDGSAEAAPPPADDGADDAAPPADDTTTEAPREATTEDPMPPQGTSSVVVDERQRELEREQAMMREETEEETEEDLEEADVGLGHLYQVGIRGGVGVPFMFALRYNGGPRCNGSDPMDPDQFCLFVGSTVITFDVSFGVTNDVEIVLGGRIGAVPVEPTENLNGQLLLGIRAYISPESIAKVYFAPSVVLDVTPPVAAVAGWGDVDFGVRGAFGVQVDMFRYLGLYVEIGVNILFIRSFGIAPDVSGGFQVRFP